MKKNWWKFLSVALLLYTFIGGLKTPLTSGLDYAIAVGEGGIKQTVTATAANSGEDSSIIGTAISITATGGGAGGTYNGATNSEFPAQNGGSGGGASAIRNATSGGSATAGQGNDGGDSPAQSPNYPGGGGGGGAFLAGGDGQSASGSPAYAAGNGGDGLASSITGTSITRAGGGGGFTYGVSVTNVSSGGTGGGGAGGRYVSSSNSYNPSRSDGEDGAANTGSGGGSASVTGSGSGSQWYGGLPGGGGSGIAILRYPTNSSPVIKTTGSLVYTQSTDGSDTVIQFTEGSGNVSFASAGIAVGEMIFNSTTGKVEYWDGFQWNMIKDEMAVESPYNNVLYTGNGNTSNPQTNIGFSPDLVWIADRDVGNYNPIQDSVRGVNSVLVTALNAAEQPSSWINSFGQITSFDPDGFNVSDGSGNTNSNFNQNGRDYVAWCFKAGGAAVANTAGSITSQVSANVAGGFSIVSYTGNGSAGATVGHGIDTPELVIVKRLSGVENWAVYSAYSYPTVPQNYLLTLDNNSAAGLNSTRWNNTAPTNAVFSVGTSQAVNASANTYIAYCWHSVPGYSKVGSFVGTGVAGKKITLDFQPAWLMIKRSSTTGNWLVIDNKINTASIKKNYIKIDEIGAENTATTGIVFESDGFSFSGGSFNQSGQTAIYLAFA